MTDAPLTVDIVIYPDRVVVRAADRDHLVIGAAEDGRLAAAAPMFDDIMWTDTLMTEPAGSHRPLSVNVRREGRTVSRSPQRLGTVVDLRTQRQRSTAGLDRVTEPKVRMARTVVEGGSGTDLEPWRRDAVLQAILQSWIEHPEQTKAFTSKESKRIADALFPDEDPDKKPRPIMRVAGVRAALEKGAYGASRQELIERYRRANQRVSNSSS